MLACSLDMSRVVTPQLMTDSSALTDLSTWAVGLEPTGMPLILELGRSTHVRAHSCAHGCAVGGGVINNVSTTATAVNPTWRNSMAYLNVPVISPVQAVSPQQIAESTNITAALDAVLTKYNAPIAAYINEQSLQPSNWQTVNWGSNYARLAQIKSKYDPHSVFTVSSIIHVYIQHRS
jgi:hypothetical protein